MKSEENQRVLLATAVQDARTTRPRRASVQSTSSRAVGTAIARASIAGTILVVCSVLDACLPSCIAWITAVYALRVRVVIWLGVTLVRSSP